MVFRVGIDLACVAEVEESLRLHGERYLTRVYTEDERRDCGDDCERLATRFAAKEAAMKALVREDHPLGWRSIGVERDEAGRPTLRLTAAAAELARVRGVRSLSLSFTRGPGLVAAVVLAEVGDGDE
jgi:holo-[acyl-carrier protein] synthase